MMVSSHITAIASLTDFWGNYRAQKHERLARCNDELEVVKCAENDPNDSNSARHRKWTPNAEWSELGELAQDDLSIKRDDQIGTEEKETDALQALYVYSWNPL